MQSLKHFITESVRSYNFTIKIAGEVDAKFLEMFKINLKKFDPIEISEPKSTPVQKDPYGFEGITNEPVTIIKAKFRYPATEPMVQQIGQLLGHNVNYIRMVSTDFNDSINAENEQYENQEKISPVLTHEEMESADGAKAASKAYGNQYLDSVAEQSKDSKLDIPYAGEKTKLAYDPFKPFLGDKVGMDSPMSKVIRPAKPQTGASKG